MVLKFRPDVWLPQSNQRQRLMEVRMHKNAITYPPSIGSRYETLGRRAPDLFCKNQRKFRVLTVFMTHWVVLKKEGLTVKVRQGCLSALGTSWAQDEHRGASGVVRLSG